MKFYLDKFHSNNKIESKGVKNMPRYAIAFDLDTKKMKDDELAQSAQTQIYQKEIPDALKKCGFSEHGQGSIYYTDDETDILNTIIALNDLKELAPNFCRYADRIHVFRMEEWSDVTERLTGHKSQSLKIINIDTTNRKAE